MIEAEEDVLDPVHEIGAASPRAARWRAAISTQGCEGRTSVVERRAVEERHAHQDVGDRALQPDELDALPGEPAFTRIEHAALEQRIRQLLHRRLA